MTHFTQALTILFRPLAEAIVRTGGGRWDAAGGGNRWRGTVAPPASPATYYDNPVIARSRAEEQYRNNAYARKAVDAIANAVSGANGITPSFQSRAHQTAWDQWSRRVYYSLRGDWSGFLLEAIRVMIVSGEVIIVALPDADAAGVPLRLMALGPEYLDTSRFDRDTQGGIQYAGMKPVAYWLYNRNPATVNFTAVSEPVPAAFVAHVYKPITPGAQRGQTWLSPVLLPIKELTEYLEAALVRAQTAALYAGFIRSPDGPAAAPKAAGVPPLEPGTMTRLNPNEEIEFSTPPDVGTSFDPFVRTQLRRIASGMEIPYEILSGDYSQVTFASGRGALLDWRRTVEAIQYGLMVPLFCQPILDLWLRFAEVSGTVSGDPGRVRWIAPEVEMLDARADVAAKVAEVRAGFTSRTEVVGRRGWRVEEIDAEIAADNARADRLRLVLDVDPRNVTQQGQQQVQPAIEGAA